MKAAISEMDFEQHSDMKNQASKKNLLTPDANVEEFLW